MAIIRYQGEDIKIFFRIKDQNGNYLNIDDIDDLYIYIIDTRGTKILELEKTDCIKDDEYLYHFWIESTLSKSIQKGDLTMQVNVIQSDAELTDTVLNSIGEETLLTIKPALIKDKS
jgi:hypothetical protein